MKLRIIKILKVLAVSALITFTGCSKDDGAIPKNIGIEDVPAVSTNLDAGGTAANITFTSQAAFQGKFKVSLFFADATTPTMIDVVGRKNATTVKVFKASVTSLPVSLTITAADIVTLFGAPLALNDTYDFAPDIYVGVKKYEAFPSTGLGSGQGVTGMSAIGYGEYVRYTVK